MSQAMQKCKSCKVTKPVPEFFRPGDKWKKRRGTCNECAVKAKANYVKRTSVKPLEGEKLCLKCRRVKPRAEFLRRDAEFSSCNDCSEKAAVANVHRLPGGEIIDGVPHRECRKCQGLFPREEFRVGSAYTSTCPDCRGTASQRVGPEHQMQGYKGWEYLDFGPEVLPTDPLVAPFTDFSNAEWRTA